MRCRVSVGGIGLAAMITTFLLAGCTPATPNAWRLNDDGTVSFASCTEFRASQMRISYFKQGIGVAEVIAEGEERTFDGGSAIAIAPEHWLVSTELDGVSEWDSVTVTFSISPFPYETSQLTGGMRDPSSLDEAGSVQIARSQLREGEWVWDRPGTTCEIGPSSSGDPIYTGALSRGSFEAMLREHPDLTSLVDALTKLGRVAPVLAFQSMLLGDLAVVALPGEDPAETVIRARPDLPPDILLAAELAVTRLGFAWEPDAVRAGETD